MEIDTMMETGEVEEKERVKKNGMEGWRGIKKVF
jgi:hypothetical protein